MLLLKRRKHLAEKVFLQCTCNRAQFFAHTQCFYTKRALCQTQQSEEKSLKNTLSQMMRCLSALWLRSLMLGDLQIVSQIKAAVKYASNKEMFDYTPLNAICNAAYKDVRTDTAINEGPASMHGVVLFIKQRYNSLKDKKIVPFGTEIGETGAKNLLKHAHKEMVLITVP